MHSNKANTICDDGIISNNSYFSTPKSERLDQLYKEQLADFRNLAIKMSRPNDIEICRKWLRVFNKISNSEKMARNCLFTLMQEQIRECGSLKEPFTDLRNCNRNLETVLNELDELFSSHLSNQHLSHRTNCTFKPNGCEDGFKHQRQLDMIQLENQDVLLKTKTAELRSELRFLGMQLIEKEMENVKLREIAEKYRFERESFEEKLHMQKKCILENIKELLLEMQQRGMVGVPMKFFQTIFSNFPLNDKEFNDIVRKYDEDLQNVFHNQFKCDFNKRKSTVARYICRKFAKSKTKLREKYERRLNAQNESHKLQLKLAKLNSFSMLRQIFVNFHDKFDSFEGWQMLKALEDKYQSVVNEKM